MSTHDLPSERFLRDLRAEVMRAAEEQDAQPGHGESGRGGGPARGHGRTLLVAAAAVVVVVASLVVVVGGTEPASAGVDVVVDGDDLVVRLTDLETRPEEIVEAAEEFGLEVRVREVPVGPSNVGRFVGGTSSELPPELRPEGGTTDSFTGFRIPRDWPGELRLDIGREAKEGERWRAASDALAPDEPAACEPLLGVTVATAREVLSDAGLRIRWFVFDPGEQERSGADVDRYEDWRVVRVLAVGPRQVWVQATRDGSWPFPPSMPAPVRDPDCD